MGKVKKHLEGRTKQERCKIRKDMGSLKSLTVQPKTRARYDQARDKFYSFLKLNSLLLPRQRSEMDNLLTEYLEHLGATGEGRALASDTLASLQDIDPRLRGQIPASWRLLKTWQVHEIPSRAPPFPEKILQALVGYFLFYEDPAMALSLLLGYYGMLRTGEVQAIRARDVLISESHTNAVVSLGWTKTGKRTGAAESVTISVVEVIRRLNQWQHNVPPNSLMVPSASQWRKKFKEGLEALEIQSVGFRPYSLRRGGATFWFSRHGSLDRILLQGRWLAARTARTYLNEGLAVLTDLKISSRAITAFHKVYVNASRLKLPPWRSQNT